jgi:hypothetical protein
VSFDGGAHDLRDSVSLVDFNCTVTRHMDNRPMDLHGFTWISGSSFEKHHDIYIYVYMYIYIYIYICQKVEAHSVSFAPGLGCESKHLGFGRYKQSPRQADAIVVHFPVISQ